MLASMMPYWKFLIFSVFMRLEIHVPPTFLGWITRCPLPSINPGLVAVLNKVGHCDGLPGYPGGPQYTSTSPFPQPLLLPRSNFQTVVSGEPAPPLNS